MSCYKVESPTKFAIIKFSETQIMALDLATDTLIYTINTAHLLEELLHQPTLLLVALALMNVL